jgi:flavodoxin
MQTVDNSNQPRILVVFFSRTGTTRGLAEHIARGTRADVEELPEARSRHGLWGWLRSGYEGTYRRSASILPLQRDLRDYELVFIGSPTWNRALSSPVRGFLEAHAGELVNVALFATCQGQGATDVNAQMASMLKTPPLAKLAMLEADVKRGPSVQVGEFTEAALCAWEAGGAKR